MGGGGVRECKASARSLPDDRRCVNTPGLRLLCLCLQGVGKTTACGKLALYLQKEKKSVMMVATDVYRPAAIEQLHKLGQVGGMDHRVSHQNAAQAGLGREGKWEGCQQRPALLRPARRHVYHGYIRNVLSCWILSRCVCYPGHAFVVAMGVPGAHTVQLGSGANGACHMRECTMHF